MPEFLCPTCGKRVQAVQCPTCEPTTAIATPQVAAKARVVTAPLSELPVSAKRSGPVNDGAFRRVNNSSSLAIFIFVLLICAAILGLLAWLASILK